MIGQASRSARRRGSSPWPGSRPSPASGGPSARRRKGGGCGRRQRLDGLASVVGDLHRGARAFEQLDRDLLVDLVVLGQEDARAAQPRLLFAVTRCAGGCRRRASAKTFTSVSTSIDLVTGLTRKPSSCSRSASSRTSSRPKAVTSTMAGCLRERLVALDVAAGLQAVHAGHPPVHEDDVVGVGRRRAALTAAIASVPGRDGVHAARPRRSSGSGRISRAAGLSSTTSTRSCARRSGTILPEPSTSPTPEPDGEEERAADARLALQPDVAAHQLDQPAARWSGRGRCRRACAWWTCRPA